MTDKPKEYIRPDILPGYTMEQETACGTAWITICYGDDFKIVETFVNLGKAGTCPKAHLEGTGKLATYAFRLGLSPAKAIRLLRGIRCEASMTYQKPSCVSALGAVVEKISLLLEEKKPREEK